jgi:hypothetical protein
VIANILRGRVVNAFMRTAERVNEGNSQNVDTLLTEYTDTTLTQSKKPLPESISKDVIVVCTLF